MLQNPTLRLIFCLAGLLILFASPVRSQLWQPIGEDSFEGITQAEDGSLFMVRYPGDILRSTDSAATWHEVYHTIRPLRTIGTIQHEVVALGYFGSMLVSIDSGIEWTSLDSSRKPLAYNE